MSKSRVKELGGRKFDVVEEGLDEGQVAEFIDKLIQQRDALLNQINSLLSYIRLSKSMVGEEDEPMGSSGQQAENRAAGTVTEVDQNMQPALEITELEQATQSVLSETIKAMEKGKKGETELYQGELELAILPPVDAAGLLQFGRRLQDSFELKIVSTDGSPSKGSLITVRLNEPQPLLQGLKQLPEVKEAAEELDISSQVSGILSSHLRDKQGRRIWVTLSTG